jgi:hypothetical protein
MAALACGVYPSAPVDRHNALQAALSHLTHHATSRNFSAAFVVIWNQEGSMLKFLLFCILLVVCWPVAIAAVLLYPIVWLILLPFRLLGLVVGGTFELIAALFYLPARMIRAI